MQKDTHEKLAHIYMRLVRTYSPSASSELETIYALYGSRAAYYASQALAIMLGRVKSNVVVDPMELVNQQLADAPEAIRLYRKAFAALTNDIKDKSLPV